MVKFKGRKCGCLPRGQEAAMLTLLLMSLLSLWRLWRSNAHSVLDDAAQPVRKFSWVAKDGIPVELALEEAEGDETDEDEDEEELEGELQEAKEPSEARPKHPERRAGAAGSSHAEEKTEGADKPCNMFTLWEYPNGAPEYVRLNVESWRRHSHGRCGEPIFLSDANIRKYIPDLPQEYFKLPYQACKSDVVRYAVIYHNGGIYMDTDFLVQEDLDPVIDLMDRDLISYSGMNPRGKECPADFSSNFLAGRKGSTFHKKVYDAQIEKMQKHCPASQKGKTVNGREVFCCFKEKDVKCDVPWAAIGEGVSHGVLRRMKADGEDFTSYCFAGDHSFVPFEIEGVLQHTPLLTDALERFEKNHVKNPLGRIAYHLFNSMTSLQTWSCKRLSNNDSFVGNLYVRSFTRGAGNKIVTGSAAQAFLEKYPQFKEQTRSQAVVPCLKKNPFAQLESMAPPAGPISDKCNIFSIAESDPSAAFDLNVDSWRRHTEELCNAPVMVNDSNVKSLLPDLPEEYFRLPGAQEKLDLIRHGLIYHHGGMVLQGDVVFLRDMSKVVQKIELHDLVSSSERRSGQATACGDSWQILFTAGKRGSRFHGAAWHFAKELALARAPKVTKHCPLSDKEKEKVCCFDDKRLNCHIPGGALGESFSSRLKQEYEGDEQEMKSYCFSEAESFRPAMFQQVLDHTPAMDAGDKIFKREHKRSLLAGFALFVPLSMTRDVRCRQLFNTRKVIGAIYAASFDVSDESPELPCKQPQMIRSLLGALAPGNPSSEGKCFVFSLKLEPEPLAAKLNLASWRRHLPACEAVLISDSNVRDWVPDVPSEYFKLPGPEEKLDFLRRSE
ncbi:unnamed protein product, partial [Effrenium voratum]